MKKLVSVLLVCLLLFCMTVPAFADLGEPEFNNWFVVCGISGYNYNGIEYDYETGSQTPYTEFFEPGTKFQVHSFYDEDGTYTLVMDDTNHKVLFSGLIGVKEADLNRYFVNEGVTIPKESGKKLDKAVTAKITPRSGVVLRQGPATTFPRYTTIKQNTQVTYEYTYEYGGYHWGFVTYKGQTGWACTDYMEATAEVSTTAATTAPTTAPTTEPSAAATTAPNTEATTIVVTNTTSVGSDAANGQNAGLKDNDAQKEEGSGLIGGLSQTKLIILACCGIAILLSVIGLVVLFVTKKSKNN